MHTENLISCVLNFIKQFIFQASDFSDATNWPTLGEVVEVSTCTKE